MIGLWIDDEQFILDGMRLIFKKDHDIRTLLTPDDALKIAKFLKPEFIVVDGNFKNSKLDGIEVAEILHEYGFKVGIYSGCIEIEERARKKNIHFLSKLDMGKEKLLVFIDLVAAKEEVANV